MKMHELSWFTLDIIKQVRVHQRMTALMGQEWKTKTVAQAKAMMEAQE